MSLPVDFDLSQYMCDKPYKYDFKKAECIIDNGFRYDFEIEKNKELNSPERQFQDSFIEYALKNWNEVSNDITK